MNAPVLCPLAERGVIAVSGSEAREFLQGLITNDMNRVSPGQTILAGLLTPQGKYLFDFFVVQHGDDFLLECEGPRAADLSKRLNFYKLRSKVLIRDAGGEFRVAAALGPEGLAAFGLTDHPGVTRAIEGGIVFADPRLTAMGARLLLQGALPETATVPVEDYHRLRLQLGVPEGSRDIAVDKYFLLEANFEELNGVDFRKGCYVGQELVSRMKHRAVLRKRILPVTFTGPPPAADTPVLAGGRETGSIRSVQGKRALAYLRLSALRPGGAALSAGEAAVTPVQPPWLALENTEYGDDED